MQDRPTTPKVLGRRHSRTKDSVRVTADARDALGRTEEAKALRERYGSRVLRNLSAHETSIRLAAHSARQSETTTAGFTGFFEIGVGWLFLEIEAGKGTRSTRIPRRRVRLTRPW
jgi:hypothetical protein